MREAGSKTDFVFDEDGALIGAYLAANYCAEHEGNIKRLQQLFDIFDIRRQPAQFGVESRRAKVVDGENILFIKRKTGEITRALLYSQGRVGMGCFKDRCLGKPKKPIKSAAEYLNCYSSGDKLAGAWANDGFALFAPNAELSQHLETMHTAFLENDAMIMMGGGKPDNPFSRPGLVIGIVSRIPDDVKQHMYDCDKDAYDLKQATEATGIYDVVDTTRYIALSPRWYKPQPDDPDAKETKHPVIFFLNPADQQHNGYGYFTVEQLTAWVNGEAPDGPIAGRGRIWEQLQRAKEIAQGKIDRLFSDEICCVPCLNIINISRRWSSARCSKCGDTENLVKPKTVKH